jgi:hypothetical protein
MATVLWSNAEQYVAIVLKATPVEKLNLERLDQILRRIADFLQFGRSAVDLARG